MALASDASIIFLEEPCMGLDKDSKKKLLQLIKKVAKSQERFVILSTQSFEEALMVSNEISFIKN